jgi:hypothetical protein
LSVAMKARCAAASLLLLVLTAASGCYNPHIAAGGLKCDGLLCPDNFHCASDLRCYPGDGGPDVPGKPACNSPTPDAATCSRPLDGSPCNPACAFGCSCGWCAVNNGAVTCLTENPGTKKSGDVCDPSNSADCSPGLYCLAECGTAHCHKYCDPSNGNADCSSGSTCSRTAISGSYQFSVCDFPKTACDPVRGSGCPSGYACYPFDKTVVCDCAGIMASGGTCGLLRDCAPGYTCVNANSVSTCQKTCALSSDCPSTTTCVNQSPTYGYCQ